MNVVVDGLMTSYQKIGHGKQTVLCLHGWGDTSKTFAKLIEQLADNYTFYVLDLPGFGATQPPANAWGVHDYSNFVKNWLAKTNINVDAIIGHSFGGAVAIVAAPGISAKKLILIASAGVRNQPSIKKSVLKAGAKVTKFPTYLLPSAKRQNLKRKVYQAIGSDSMMIPHMQTTYQRIIKEDVREAAKNYKGQALLIYGTKDQDTPVADGQRLNAVLLNSKLETIAESGHFVHQEAATQVAKMIKGFLQ